MYKEVMLLVMINYLYDQQDINKENQHQAHLHASAQNILLVNIVHRYLKN